MPGFFMITYLTSCRLFGCAFKGGRFSSSFAASIFTCSAFTTFRIFRSAAWTTLTWARAATTRLAFGTRCFCSLRLFFNSNLKRCAFDNRLWTAAIVVRWLLVVIANLLCLRRNRTCGLVVVVAVNVVAIAFVVVVRVTLITLEPFLHMRLCSSNDAVVVFCVLQIVFSHNPVTGALRITGQCGIFFSNVLGSTANFYIRAGAVIGPSKRIPALAVEVVVTTTTAIVVIVVISTPSAALVLLSWPHQLLT